MSFLPRTRLGLAALLLSATCTAWATGFAEGEVRKLDAEAGKITLKHGEIASLDMPPMTMVFELKDKALLNGLQAGTKVRFKAIKEAGRFVVTEIQPLR